MNVLDTSGTAGVSIHAIRHALGNILNFSIINDQVHCWLFLLHFSITHFLFLFHFAVVYLYTTSSKSPFFPFSVFTFISFIFMYHSLPCLPKPAFRFSVCHPPLWYSTEPFLLSDLIFQLKRGWGRETEWCRSVFNTKKWKLHDTLQKMISAGEDILNTGIIIEYFSLEHYYIKKRFFLFYF